MIFKNKPNTWRDLQDRVCLIFDQCGYYSESPKTIKTARSESLEVDVYVETNLIPKQIILCECKYWDSNIPQSIVHAFRAQVVDAGANTGLLISKNGFQTGAISAAKYSNISLLTLDDFEAIYKPLWYIKYFLPLIHKMNDPLTEYTEPINSRIFRKADLLPENSRKRFIELRREYGELSSFLLALCAPAVLEGHPNKNLMKALSTPPQLPLKGIFSEPHIDAMPAGILECTSFEELTVACETTINEALSKFDEVFGERA